MKELTQNEVWLFETIDALKARRLFDGANDCWAMLAASPNVEFEIETDDGDGVPVQLDDPTDKGYYTLVNVVGKRGEVEYKTCIPLPLLNPMFIKFLLDELVDGRVAVVERVEHNRQLSGDTQRIQSVVNHGVEYPIHNLHVDGVAVQWDSWSGWYHPDLFCVASGYAGEVRVEVYEQALCLFVNDNKVVQVFGEDFPKYSKGVSTNIPFSLLSGKPA